MANTYSQIYIHTVFAVKYRHGLIHPEWEEKLYAVIGNLISETGGKPIITNGVKDHVHCFFHGNPSVPVSEMMKVAKAKSAKWVNDKSLLTHKFAWQRGYGCFSYGHSQRNEVYNYILNQEAHHKKMSFREEYKKFLHAFDIDYEEAYIFGNPE